MLPGGHDAISTAEAALPATLTGLKKQDSKIELSWTSWWVQIGMDSFAHINQAHIISRLHSVCTGSDKLQSNNPAALI